MCIQNTRIIDNTNFTRRFIRRCTEYLASDFWRMHCFFVTGIYTFYVSIAYHIVSRRLSRDALYKDPKWYNLTLSNNKILNDLPYAFKESNLDQYQKNNVENTIAEHPNQFFSHSLLVHRHVGEFLETVDTVIMDTLIWKVFKIYELYYYYIINTLIWSLFLSYQWRISIAYDLIF